MKEAKEPNQIRQVINEMCTVDLQFHYKQFNKDNINVSLTMGFSTYEQ